MLRTKTPSRDEAIRQQSVENYQQALQRVRIARSNFDYADPDLSDVAYEELRNAEEALNLAIKRVKMTEPTITC